jgi:F-type H+-transporting ATPase subunit a
MFAGHLAIFSFLMLIFLLSPWAGAFAVPFTIFIYLLEILSSLIQAFVFTLLSCIFITMASSAH